MALTAYCKKCAREVEAAEVCPRCGTRLGKTAAHAAWCVEKTPLWDWMSWNSVTRVLLPAALVILLIVLAAEGFSGGAEALERLIASGFLTALAMLLGIAAALVALMLFAQGKELTDYVVDNRGIHETRYLPNPTPLKLLARLKSPTLMAQADPEAAVPVVKIDQKDLPWREVSRVQLWPEKCMILYYAPAWWLRIPVVCEPFIWADVTGLIREKIGKKKGVRLPDSLVVSAPPARRKAAKPRAKLVPEVEEAIGQIRMEELMEEAAAAPPGEAHPRETGPGESQPAESWPGESLPPEEEER